MKRKILPVSRAVLVASHTAKLWHCILFFSKCQYERTCLGCCSTQLANGGSDETPTRMAEGEQDGKPV